MAVKEICRFCEHFLVNGPDLSENAPKGSAGRATPTASCFKDAMANYGYMLDCPACGVRDLNLLNYTGLMVIRSDLGLFTLTCPELLAEDIVHPAHPRRARIRRRARPPPR